MKDASFLNPLSNGDSSNLNISNTEYQKQAYEVSEEAERKPEKKWSPMLEKDEKEKAINLGQSLDSKKVTSALGYLDLKQICFCLAKALNKHLDFSKGQMFLDDLQRIEDSEQQKAFEFSYKLGADMRIDLDEARAKKQKMEEENKKEFDRMMAQQQQAKKTDAPA